ncbi:DNA polymerase beta domain protein region [Rhodothermus marinus SG0.5JP17-172]|jgi:predicted nucleotidyltransferase|uniref:nucleotidyltransferase family protein n=1 Tax=Rhodothermus marinus TaxID=29549 RepID=UPI000223DA58|nr:nucleotidyltransferase [Rhodothermus marinus]AEN72493.1 DNA polymerase beta domain protein region [Rhodothermus marinus SG0.5JP17-172]MBO2493027.1 nucleotidyltransferase [Rhodothermus marinus]
MEARIPELEKLRQQLRALLPELRERFGVVSLALFGSYVRGQAGAESDLDVLVELDDRPFSLLQFVELEQWLSDRLGVRVDLVEKSALKEDLKSFILREAVPI